MSKSETPKGAALGRAPPKGIPAENAKAEECERQSPRLRNHLHVGEDLDLHAARDSEGRVKSWSSVALAASTCATIAQLSGQFF